MVYVPPITGTIAISIGGAVPDCDTLTVCDDTPEPLTVRSTLRTTGFVLEAGLTVTVPSPEPDIGATDNHVALKLTVQLMLEATVNVFGESVAAKINAFVDTCNTGVIPACVMLTVRGVRPSLVMERELVRCSTLVLAAAVTMRTPLLAPDIGFVDSQDELLPTVQLVLAVMFSCFGESEAVKLKEGGVTISKGAASMDTGMIFGVKIPVPVIVIVAERVSVSLFDVAFTLTVALLAPVVGVIVTHEASQLIFHELVLESIVNDCSSPEKGK